MKKTFTTLLLLLGLGALLQAQDPFFSQFYAAPLQLNPAMAGVYNGKYRITANYKQQWNSLLDTRPFQTLAAGFDLRNAVGRNDFATFGFSALRDQAGRSEFQRVAADLTFSYMKQLDGSRYRSYDQFLVAGAQVGLGQHSLDYQNLWFSSQFDLATEQLDQSLPSGEVIDQTSNTYLNFNAGLLWYVVFDDNQSLWLGGAIHHLNSPRVSFIDNGGTESLDRRWLAQVGGELPFSHSFSILPAAVVTGQGPSLLSIFGANFRYTNRDWKEIAIRAGAWGHLVKDQLDSFASPNVTFTAILEIERWNFGLSYDVGAGKLAAPTNGRGAFELSLIYVHPPSRKEKVNCPNL